MKINLNNTYIGILVYLLLGILMLGFAPQTYAAESTFVSSTLRVSPVLLKIRLEPGTRHIYPVTIENLTNAPMPIRASVEGFDPSDEESGFTPNPPSEVSPLAQWISIADPDAIIPARESYEFLLKVSVPSTVPLGGYYAIVYFTPLYQNGSIGSKIGLITLANIGVQDEIRNKAVISEFKFEKMIYENGPITSTLRITNDALHYFSTKPKLHIAPFWGESDAVELDEKIILPGKSRYWKSVFTIQNSKWGIYKASVTARLENGDSITKTIPLLILPYRLIFISIATLMLCIWIIVKRKNIRKAAKLLFTSDEEASAEPPQPIKHSPEVLQEPFADDSRLSPDRIMRTLTEQQGSVNKTAKLLGIHRSTIHRWKLRAGSLNDTSEHSQLKRKSTRPHHIRTTSLTTTTIEQIVALHKEKQLTAKQIKDKLQLTVSDRTVLRMIRKYKDSLK